MMEPQALELCEVLKAGLSGGGDLDTTINRTVAITSIAISLKRIADAMQEPNEYGEVGGAAVAGAIARSLRDR